MANIFSVSNSDELMKALASASGGDTIELAAGDYGMLKLVDGYTGFDVTFDAEVTIRSAKSDQPASFSGMELRGVSNLTFDGLVFDYKFNQDDPIWIKPFQVGYGSSDVTIRNSVFDGDTASGISEIEDGYGYGIGLSVRIASDIVVENNEFFNWHRGATYSQTQDLAVIGNDVHGVRSDGFNFVEVKSALIEKNYFHSFNGLSGWNNDHRDMIQFWTSGTSSPTTDVVIRDNIFDIGEGSFTQSIFMRNEEVDTGRAGAEMFYQNILIENNTIYNAHLHGITVGETDGLTIKNNTVLQAEGEMHGATGTITIPKINVSSASTSVVIKDNITSAINGYEAQPDWNIDGNAILQPEDYLESFVTSSLDSTAGAHNFVALPEGAVDILQAGSTHTQFDVVSDSLRPYFQVYSDESSSQTLILDASLTVGPLGHVLESDAEFQWTFGDGNTATGQIVKHDFTAPGYHDVTLTVVSQDGTTMQAQFTTGIVGDDIVQFDAQAGFFETLAYGEEVALDGSGLPLQNTTDGYTLKLGGEGTQASIAAGELSQFFGTDSFEVSMTLKADNANSWGEIAQVYGSFSAHVDQDGSFRLMLFPDDGSRVKVVSEEVTLNDGNEHDVTISFDGEAGVAEILVDGKVVGSKTVTGSLGGDVRSLDFGNPWGKQNFDGELSAFSLSAESKVFPVYDGDTMPLPSTETSTTETDATPESDPVVAEPVEEPVVAEPVEEPVVAEPVEEPVVEEESSVSEPLLNGGYQLDFASIKTSGTVQLHDNAHLVGTEDGSAIAFDGKKDFVSLGRLTEFEKSQKIAFSVDFVSDNADGGTEHLVWNHNKFGLTLEGDGLLIRVQNNDGKFRQGFQVDDLDLNDGNLHNATVMVDAETDRLQIVVDDVLVLDEQDTDFDFVGADMYEWGWSLGTGRSNWFEGEVHEFQVSDDFEFIESAMEDGTLLV